MLRVRITVLVLLFVVSDVQARAPAQGQWIVVTAPAFRDAIAPLCEHRKADGLRVVVVNTQDILSPREIKAGHGGKLREHIVRLCRAHQGPSYVLLVGAIEAGKLAEAEDKVVPTMPGSAGRMKDQPSDNAYGCLDKDLLPTVAVGRFPVRTEEEARRMVRKTIDFEKDRTPAPWRRRLTVLAGVPAFNPFVDRLVESLAFARFERLDPVWHGQALYHNASSRFCVPDGQLRTQALKYVQDGQLFTFYFGHSGPEGFYADTARYLDRDDWSQLKIAHGPGVFFTFGCTGCQLKGDGSEGYGVHAMRNPHGPVAVIGSHGICFAAMVQLAADGLFESAFAGKLPERLADIWLTVKQGLARGKIDALTFTMLDAVDGDGRISQETQRAEHLEMFVLLGDPALRLPVVAQDVELNVAEMLAPGLKVIVKGQVPERLKDATVRLTLERPVSSVPTDLEPALAEKPGNQAARDRVMFANHERANRFVLSATEVQVRGGRFETTLTLPARPPWPRLILRAYAANASEEGLGTRVLDVQPGPGKIKP